MRGVDALWNGYGGNVSGLRCLPSSRPEFKVVDCFHRKRFVLGQRAGERHKVTQALAWRGCRSLEALAWWAGKFVVWEPVTSCSYASRRLDQRRDVVGSLDYGWS